MIDDKKIEEAAQFHRFEIIASMHGSTLGTPMQCFKEEVDTETELIENSFITGAKWAINEFLKDLWHPNTEKPKAGKKILAYTIDGYETITYIGEGEIDCGTNWMDIVSDMAIGSWCYPEDLLPKKEANK